MRCFIVLESAGRLEKKQIAIYHAADAKNNAGRTALRRRKMAGARHRSFDREPLFH
jgi:hypothetical protein